MVTTDHKFNSHKLKRIAMLAEMLIERCIQADKEDPSLKHEPSYFRKSIWRFAYEAYRETLHMKRTTGWRWEE